MDKQHSGDLTPVNGQRATVESSTPGFTSGDLADWKAFEKVRSGGRYNMFDPRARRATGLSADRYLFVMKNFSALKSASIKESA